MKSFLSETSARIAPALLPLRLREGEEWPKGKTFLTEMNNDKPMNKYYIIFCFVLFYFVIPLEIKRYS